MKIIDGKKISEKVLEEVIEEIKKINYTPTLAVILVGDDPSSKIYVKNKTNTCNKCGIKCQEYLLSKDTTENDLLNLIDELNAKDNINGILLQSPVPKHIDINKLFSRIDPIKDVDGFNPINYGKLLIGEDSLVSATSLGIIRLLKEEKINLTGKNCVIIGRSNIVGKPLSLCLLNNDATVTIAHSKTVNLKDITSKADILISATGQKALVKKNMVKDGAIVIDVGINRTSDKICGDVDFEDVKDKCSYITKVPGGVGPMTIAYLMKNIVKATKMQI